MLPREGEREGGRRSSVMWQYKKKLHKDTYWVFLWDWRRTLLGEHDQSVLRGDVMQCDSLAYTKAKDNNSTIQNTPRGVLQLSWRWKKRKNIDHLKATEYNLFVSLFFLRNFFWSVDLLWNGPSCHWTGRFEIHAANKGVVLSRQKLFISLAKSCCWQESVLLGWNKSSTWFQDNLNTWKRINKYSSVLLILFTTWRRGGGGGGGRSFLYCCIFKDRGRLCRICCLLFFVYCIIVLLYYIEGCTAVLFQLNNGWPR